MEYAHAEINEKKIQRLLYFIVQQSFFMQKNAEQRKISVQQKNQI